MRVSRPVRLFLAVAMMLLLVPVAGRAAAAPPSEVGLQVGGYYIQPAVDTLKRFGIVTGDPDGRMRLHDTITRAELAKVVVTALGQGDAAARAMESPPAFPDVKDHWARGHVHVARQLGIIGGYQDGTFRPASPVTNAEALTMLLRAAGLKPNGPWPQSYLEAARSGGVLTDPLTAKLPANLQATRGAVFLLADRSFTLLPDATGKAVFQRVFGQAAPTLQLTVKASGAELGVTPLPEVSLIITAPGALLVQVNGRPAVPGQAGFAAKVALDHGRNEILVLAVDEFGNRTTQQMTILRSVATKP